MGYSWPPNPARCARSCLCIQPPLVGRSGVLSGIGDHASGCTPLATSSGAISPRHPSKCEQTGCVGTTTWKGFDICAISRPSASSRQTVPDSCGQWPRLGGQAAQTAALQTAEPHGCLSQHGLAEAPRRPCGWLSSVCSFAFQGSAKHGSSSGAPTCGWARRQRVASPAGESMNPPEPVALRLQPTAPAHGRSATAVAPPPTASRQSVESCCQRSWAPCAANA